VGITFDQAVPRRTVEREIHALLSRQRLQTIHHPLHQRTEIHALMAKGLLQVLHLRIDEEIDDQPVELVRLSAADRDVLRDLLRRATRATRRAVFEGRGRSH
jgi:hypothetical protein